MSITGGSGIIRVNNANLEINAAGSGILFSDGRFMNTAPPFSDSTNTVFFSNTTNAFVVTEYGAGVGLGGNLYPQHALSVSGNLTVNNSGTLTTVGDIYHTTSNTNVSGTDMPLKNANFGTAIDGTHYGCVQIVENSNAPLGYGAGLGLQSWILNGHSVYTAGFVPNSTTFGFFQGFVSSGNDILCMNSSRNVGIRTTNPIRALDVDTGGFRLQKSSTVYILSYVSSDIIEEKATTLIKKANSHFFYTTSEVLLARINSTGMTIGNIAPSAYKLNVDGNVFVSQSTSFNPAIQIGNNITYDDDNLYGIRWGGNGLMGMGLHSETKSVFGSQGLAIHIPNSEEFSIKTGGWANLFAINSTKAYFKGNVGIGTTAPSANLHVAGSFHVNNTGTVFEVGSDRLIHKTAYNLWSTEAGTERMRLDTNTGNLGIGTTNPRNPLQVVTTGNNYATFSNILASGQRTAGIRLGTPYASGHDAYCAVIESFNNHTAGYNADLRFRLSNGNSAFATERMRITSAGNVGIGTATPGSAKLQVNGVSGTIGSGNRRYFKHDFQNVTTGPDTDIQNTNSIAATGSIVTNEFFVSTSGALNSSDERIKSNIQDINDTVALDQLRLLQPKTYQYKDVRSQGVEPVIGFIAQEVKEVISKAVEIRTDVIPNIYELANVSQSNVITFTNFNTSELAANCNIIRLKTIQDDDATVTLSNVIDEHTIQVVEDLSKFVGSVDENGNVITETVNTTYTQEEYDALESKNGINITYTPEIAKEEYDALTEEEKEAYTLSYSKTETVNVGDHIFVYGQEVNDFNFLRKETIFTIATAALQEVDRQQQADKERIATLEGQVAALLTRIEALENNNP